MKITLLADTPEQLRDEIARFIRRFSATKYDQAKLAGNQRRIAQTTKITNELDILVETISEMEVVSSAELFATKLKKGETK